MSVAGAAAVATVAAAPAVSLDELARQLGACRRWTVLSGAGCSTASGIPDYRDRDGAWKRAEPMRYQEFVGSDEARKRYWARAVIGWRGFRDRQPNAAHRALARLEARGRLTGLITQNVDGLHERAGSRSVIDLHGRLDQVVCLRCAQRQPRDTVQRWFADRNPAWMSRDAEMAPDGDVLLEADFSSFALVDCPHCGGVLKPDVVYFGEPVPPQRVEQAYQWIASSDALFVVGSSLMVYSGYRFVLAAKAAGKPIFALNLGRTRGDAELSAKAEADCGAGLSLIEQTLQDPI
jgi:NAD-dependent SIR2 family protein deacetylase